jgi:hypothetical protein
MWRQTRYSRFLQGAGDRRIPIDEVERVVQEALDKEKSTELVREWSERWRDQNRAGGREELALVHREYEDDDY